MPLCTDSAIFFGTIAECDVFAVAYDDVLIICKKKNKATIVNNKPKKSFVSKDLGRVSKFVGMTIDNDEKDKMTLSQMDAIEYC